MTLLDSQRWAESSRGAEPGVPLHLWDLSSLQSPTGTSETLPSLSTSIEVGTGPEPAPPLVFCCEPNGPVLPPQK